MVGKRNNMIPNVHFHKHWQRHVRLWFNQPARKLRRRNNRLKKGKAVFPRPTNTFRPIVNCPSSRYNTKIRFGRGFSLAEIKAAKLTPGFAQSISISVEYRRIHKSWENIKRLKEYMAKMIVFPINEKKLRQNQATAEEIKFASQFHGKIFPIIKNKPVIEIRPIQTWERKFEAFKTLRKEQTDAKLVGIRAKQEAKENDKNFSRKDK